MTVEGADVTPGAQPPQVEGTGERPILSVIIACLDAAATLGAQLEALASQTCPVPWELLLCDNGSTDESIAIAESYRERIPGLQVLDASVHRGAGPARNFGVENARGEWVAFCDADDEVAADWLARMAAALTRHPFVAGRFDSYRLNGARVLRSRPLQQQTELQSSDLGARLPHAGGGNLGIHRAEFLRVGGFDPKIRWLEDTDFSWRVQLAGIPLVFCDDVVVHVRLRQTFRTMYAQGRQYGIAQAMLEERYGRPSPPTGSIPVHTEASAVPQLSGVARLSRFTSSVVDHLVGGRLFWRIGWVVGHRGYRPGEVGAGPTALPTRVA